MGFGSGDARQAGCKAQKRYPLQRRGHRCDAAPLCGWGPARQMARNRAGDGLSIKWHFLDGGRREPTAPKHKEEYRVTPTLQTSAVLPRSGEGEGRLAWVNRWGCFY